MTLCKSLAATALLSSFLSAPALAAGLDRDGLLTEAPATPDPGNVRITGGGEGQVVGSAAGTVNASVMWTPIEHFAGDVGGYFLSEGTFGPSARLRYQLLNQASHGIDLALGARYKWIGFSINPNVGGHRGEMEFLVAGGRKFGPLDVALNAVVGAEVGEDGKDAELKALVGYNLFNGLRLGVDARVQAEFQDPTGIKVPSFTNDVALVAGPSASWLVTPKVQVQALAGTFKGRGDPAPGLGGQLLLAVDL
jgi:hypothetical protein